MSIADVAGELEIGGETLARFEASGQGLSVYDLERLAALFHTRIGAWIYNDQEALPRGANVAAARAATKIGVGLMDEYLAAETLAG